MNKGEITNELFQLRDESYAYFQAKLIPNIPREKIIGVRTPIIKSLAKKISDEARDAFIKELPHDYFDEDQLHAFIISLDKDFDKCIFEVETFLPYINNWATCDQLSPVAFKKNPERLLPYIKKWIASEKTYTVRFAIGLLLQHFLGDNFCVEYAETVASVRSDEYYVKMMVAWYFATALAKRYDDVLPFIENNALDRWAHNKAIQKSVESYRIKSEQKEYLKSLKIRD